MRYRRLSYRYALVLPRGGPHPLGEVWRSERAGVRLAQTCWRPAADIYETPDAAIVTVELAGIEPEDVDILLYEDAIVIEGSRRPPTAGAGGVFHTAEIRQGAFRLELPLPGTFDLERVDTAYDRGMLRITLPKTNAR
jgi:HSP20 family protein